VFEALEEREEVDPAAVWLVLAIVVDAVANPLSLVADEAVVVVSSAVTPVTVWTVPSGAVYTPVMALPLPPTSS
jgi:hypothetical protein